MLPVSKRWKSQLLKQMDFRKSSKWPLTSPYFWKIIETFLKIHLFWYGKSSLSILCLTSSASAFLSIINATIWFLSIQTNSSWWLQQEPFTFPCTARGLAFCSFIQPNAISLFMFTSLFDTSSLTLFYPVFLVLILKMVGNGLELPKLSWNLISYRDWWQRKGFTPFRHLEPPQLEVTFQGVYEIFTTVRKGTYSLMKVS